MIKSVNAEKRKTAINKPNKYDYRVIFLIALIAFGGIGGAFQPIRIVGLLCSPMVMHILFSGQITRQQKWVFTFFGCWFVYMVFSLYWTPDRGEGLKEVVYYYTHFNIFFLMVFWVQKAVNPLKSILLGWIFVLVLTLPIALYEVITFNHLSISRFGSDKMKNLGGDIVKYRFASTTFGNSNTYVVLIGYCLPFLLGKLLIRTKRKIRIILWGLLFVSTFILFINASRGGILCLMIYLGIFVYYFSLKGKPLFKKIKGFIGIALLFAVAAFVLQSYSNDFFANFLFRISDGGASFTEDNTRFHLYDMALTLLNNSLFIGTGVGSEQAAMATLSSGITATHNLFLEVLMQYGILVFIFFGVFLIKIFSKIRKLHFKPNKFILVAFLVAFVPLFIINSGYLLMPSLWVLFASLFIMGTEPKIVLTLKNS